MKNKILRCFFYFLFIVLQLGFVSALPGFWRTIPLFFAFCAYELQSNKDKSAMWWLIVFGVMLSFLHLGEAPYEFISYSISAWIAYWSSARLFSNQSFYGVLSCAGLSFFILTLMQNLFLFFIYWIRRSFAVNWHDVVLHQLTSFVCLLAVVVVMYIFIPRLVKKFSKVKRPYRPVEI